MRIDKKNNILSESLPENTLFCVTSLRIQGGGIARFNRELLTFLNELPSANQRIKVLSLLDSPEILKGHPYHHLDIETFEGKKLKFAFRYLSLLRNLKPRLIFFDHVGISQLGLLQPFRNKIPYVVFLHGIELLNLTKLKKKALERALERWTNSVFTQNRLKEKTQLSGEKCHLGIEETKPSFFKPKALIFEDAFGQKEPLPSNFFLIISRLDPREKYKGHDLILQAMKQAQEKGRLTPLVIVGEGKDKRRIRKLAVNLGLGTHVYFTNFINELEKHYLLEECRAFLMPSRNEGFGLVYLEAMQHGKPCVGSRSDAAQEVIEDGVTGFTIDIKDIEKLSFCLLELSNNDMLCVDLGKKAKQRFLKDFSSDAFCQRLKERFKKTAFKL